MAAAVAEYLSSVRREHRFTLDQVAQAGRSHGANWSASSVSNIERGQASLTLPTLLLLGMAIGDLTGRPLPLSSLLGDAERITLGKDGGTVSRSWLDGVLAGGPIIGVQSGTGSAGSNPEWDEGFEDEVLQRMREQHYSEVERSDMFEQLVEDHQAPPEPRVTTSIKSRVASLAEERAAKKLGITVDWMRQLALNRWGRTLEAEAAKRAGENSSPQARGRVTRVLVDELRASIESER